MFRPFYLIYFYKSKGYPFNSKFWNYWELSSFFSLFLRIPVRVIFWLIGERCLLPSFAYLCPPLWTLEREKSKKKARKIKKNKWPRLLPGFHLLIEKRVETCVFFVENKVQETKKSNCKQQNKNSNISRGNEDFKTLGLLISRILWWHRIVVPITSPSFFFFFNILGISFLIALFLEVVYNRYSEHVDGRVKKWINKR